MSFVSDMQRFADQTEQSMEQLTRNIRLEVVSLVTERMPVDTGQAKGSVVASTNSPADSPSIIDNSSGSAAAINRARGAINAPADQVFYFTSNSPYIGVLENGGYSKGPYATNKTTRDGYSVQAPYGMFKVSAIQIREGISSMVNNAN